MARIFVSHSGRDNDAAVRLFGWLREHGFSEAFLDVDKHSGIQPGADWERTLYRELERSQAVILVVTKNWLESKWCFAEFAQARALGKAIFPVVESPSGEQLVGSDLQAIDLRSDRENGLQALSRALTEIALQSAAGFALPIGEPPFPGLSALEEKHAAVFFGRDDVLARLTEALRRRRVRGGERLIALLGASGSGKSSLLRAGLVARLKRDRAHWIVLPPVRPQSDPFAHLVDALLFQIDEEHAERWESDLTGNAPERALVRVARHLRKGSGSPEAQIVVPVDQGEELFTTASADSADRFFRLLSAALSGDLPFLAVMAMRSDHLGQLQNAPGRRVPFEAFPLEPLPLERIGMLIRGPARLAGITVEDELVSTIMHDAATPDALPLLAFTLRELYERHGRDGSLTLAEYESLGDRKLGITPLAHAIRLAAEDALPENSRSVQDERVLRETFVPGLVRVSADGHFVRRPARLDRLPAAARPLIDKLIDARLLVRRSAVDEATGATIAVVEVAHEALFRVWPALSRWIEDERDFLIGKGRLEAALDEWRSLAGDSRERAFLAGVLLDRARAWLADHPGRLTPEERTFIEESARREAQQVEALRRSRSKFLADLSRQWLADGRVDAALAVARLAVPVERPDWPRVRSAENALALAVQTYATMPVRPVVGFVGHEGTVRGVAFSADHTRVLTWSYDGTARLWNAENGEQEFLVRHDAGIRGARLGSGDARLLTWSFDGTARLWDTRDGRLLCVFRHDDVLEGAVFSADDTRVLTWAHDGTARVWDARTAEAICLLPHEAVVWGAVFRDGDQNVLTWSFDGVAAVWNAATGERLAHVKHESSVRGATMLGSDRLLTWSSDSAVRLSDASTGAESRALGHERAVGGVELSASQQRVMTWADRTVRLWSLSAGDEPLTLRHDQVVLGARWSKDDSRVISWSSDQVVKVWDAASGTELTHGTHDDFILGACLSNNAGRMLSWAYDGTARLSTIPTGDPETDRKASRPVLKHAGIVRDARFSLNDEWVWTFCDDGSVRLWRSSGEEFARLEHPGEILAWSYYGERNWLLTASGGTARLWETVPPDRFTLLDHGGAAPVGGVFSRDSRRVLTWARDGTARLWNALTGEPLLALPGESAVKGAAFSRDDTLFLTWSADGPLRVWDAGSGAVRFDAGCQQNVIGAALSTDNGWLMAWTDSEPPALFDMESGSQSRRLGDAAIQSGWFTPDGRRVLTVSRENGARLWDRRSGEQLRLFGAEGVSGAAWSADGQRIVTWTGRVATLFDLQSGRCQGELRHDRPVLAASFSADGRRLITRSDEYTARIWDASTGTTQQTLRHQATVSGAIFLPATDRVVTWSADAAVHLWDAASGRRLLELTHEGLRRVLVSESGGLLVTEAAGVLAWDLETGNLVGQVPEAGRSPSISPDLGLLLDTSGRLWAVSCPTEPAAARAARVVERLRPLSRHDRCRAYIDEPGCDAVLAVPERSWFMKEDVVRTTERSASWPAGQGHETDSDFGSYVQDMRIEVVVNEHAEVFIFHTQTFGARLKRIEIDRLNRAVSFLTHDGIHREFGLPITPQIFKHVERATRVMMVQMDHRTGEPLSGGYYPVLLY